MALMKASISNYDPRGAYLAARTNVGPGEDDCWLWTLKPDRDGYGVATFGGEQWRAHRLSYTHSIGPIPAGLELDHVCEQRICVRPSHLEPVTNFENFVRKYLREGRPRENAEELAQYDIERVQRDHEDKVAMRDKANPEYAAERLAAGAGVEVGSLVRRSSGSAATVWIVRGVIAGERGDVYLSIESSTSGHEILVSLTSVTPA